MNLLFKYVIKDVSARTVINSLIEESGQAAGL